MIKDRSKNSENPPPNNGFQKILILLGLVVVILAFVGGISTAILFMNRKKIFSHVEPSVYPSPIALSPTASPSPSNILPSSSPTVSLSPSNILPSSSPTESPSVPSSSPGTKNPIGLVNRQGLTFALQSCKKSITDVTTQKIQCFINITSTQDNSQVSLYPNSSQSMRSRILALGQENVSTGASLGSNSNYYSVANNLIKNTPMTAIFYFEKVPLQINKIEVLEISAAHQGDIKIEFRDVPLSDS